MVRGNRTACRLVFLLGGFAQVDLRVFTLASLAQVDLRVFTLVSLISVGRKTPQPLSG